MAACAARNSIRITPKRRSTDGSRTRPRRRAAKTETRAAPAAALDEILTLLHPFMPLVTEELWQVTAEQGPPRHHMLALDAWPAHDGLDDTVSEGEIGWVVDLITAIRSVRVEMNIPP